MFHLRNLKCIFSAEIVTHKSKQKYVQQNKNVLNKRQYNIIRVHKTKFLKCIKSNQIFQIYICSFSAKNVAF